MFSFNAFINWINRNNDQVIQQSEISDFQKSQKSPSIFTEYFNSINSDIDIKTFRNNVANVIEEEFAKGNEIIQLDFIDKKQAKQFQNFSKKQMKIDKKEEEKYWENTKEELKRNFGWKFNNEDEFNQIYELLKKECMEFGGNINDKFGNLPVTHTITKEGFQLSGGYDISLPYNFIMPDMNWSNSAEIFHNLSYYENTFSQTPQEHMPAGYNVNEVFEKGKTIGLGISAAHNSGNKGKGVCYAIIDTGTRDGKFNEGNQHNDIHFADYQVSKYSENVEWLNHFHGRAVSYIAQEIAPEADCYYYATHYGNGIDDAVTDNLNQILEKNKTLPDDKKIRVVSMSMPLYGGKEAERLADELEKQGVWVLTSGKNGDIKKFGYLEKINPNGDVDDFNNYQIAWENNTKKFDNLYINSGDRTVPDPNGDDVYRHDSVASQSWAIPVLAGYYVLACQADPAMTKDKFYELANATARVIESTEPIYKGKDNDAKLVGRTTKKISIKIIDIQALLEKIQNINIGKNAIQQFNQENPKTESSTFCQDLAQYLERYGNNNKKLKELKSNPQFADLVKYIEDYQAGQISIDELNKRAEELDNGNGININCEDRAKKIQENLSKQGIRSEIISLAEIDNIEIREDGPYFARPEHAFCIVGLDENADTTDPSTWGKSALIVDAWLGKTFSVEEGINYYKEFFRYNDNRDENGNHKEYKMSFGTQEQLQAKLLQSDKE